MAAPAPRARDAQVEAVHRLLAGYAARGVFRALSGGVRRRGRVTFTVRWHHDRRFRLVVDPAAGVVRFPELLPGAPARSPMVKDLRAFVRRFTTTDVPSHRRIDPAKARPRLAARAGTVSLGLITVDGDLEYATRRLVHLAHEVFMVFLPDGPYDAYRVEQLGLDPNLAWF